MPAGMMIFQGTFFSSEAIPVFGNPGVGVGVGVGSGVGVGVGVGVGDDVG